MTDNEKNILEKNRDNINDIIANQDKIFVEFDFVKNSIIEILRAIEKVRERKKIMNQNFENCKSVNEKELAQIKKDIQCVKVEIDDIKKRIESIE